MKRTPEEVGEIVATRRAQRYGSAREAAAAAGMSNTTWSKIEAGGHVSPGTWLDVCKLLDWPSDARERLLAGADTAPFLRQVAPETMAARLAAVEKRLDGIERRLRADDNVTLLHPEPTEPLRQAADTGNPEEGEPPKVNRPSPEVEPE